jgi:hypothetical protein
MSNFEKEYHPENSRVSDAALADFIRRDITGNLLEVPGIGEDQIYVLESEGIYTTYQLIGRYLMYIY